MIIDAQTVSDYAPLLLLIAGLAALAAVWLTLKLCGPHVSTASPAPAAPAPAVIRPAQSSGDRLPYGPFGLALVGLTCVTTVSLGVLGARLVSPDDPAWWVTMGAIGLANFGVSLGFARAAHAGRESVAAVAVVIAVVLSALSATQTYTYIGSRLGALDAAQTVEAASATIGADRVDTARALLSSAEASEAAERAKWTTLQADYDREVDNGGRGPEAKKIAEDVRVAAASVETAAKATREARADLAEAVNSRSAVKASDESVTASALAPWMRTVMVWSLVVGVELLAFFVPYINYRPAQAEPLSSAPATAPPPFPPLAVGPDSPPAPAAPSPEPMRPPPLFPTRSPNAPALPRIDTDHPTIRRTPDLLNGAGKPHPREPNKPLIGLRPKGAGR
ncbi:MAG: hypothetical protein AAFW46_14280 [Pseudomonadota bacterium]